MRILVCAILLATMLCQVGCGRPTARVSGAVRYGGVPVTDATVMLLTEDNQVFRAELDPRGSFVIDGVTQGPVKIAIQQALPHVPPRPPPNPKQGDVKTNTPRPAPVSRPSAARLPERLGDPDRSGMRFDLNQAEFEWSIDIPVEQRGSQPDSTSGTFVNEL